MGNILTVSGSSSESYTYDTHDKLKKAVVNGVTYTYTYDVNGNILSKSDGTNTDTYTYGNTNWVDLLTAYNGNTITYDTPGNPTSWYDGATMTWVNGRRLASISATSAHGAMSFIYDADGLRLTKTVGGVVHRYLWQNGKLVSEAWGDKFLEFFYDEKGVPLSFLYRSSATADVWKYLYVTNLQGDVIGITTPDGESRAVYTYDPFGKPLTATGTMASINPLRYRGYYYDTESGLYYLKSRYYDPGICRFINADEASMLGIDSEFVSYNLFAYCKDNPINRVDENGYDPIWSLKNDWAGLSILWHWLFGGGEDYVVSDGRWGDYMRKNELLTQQIEEIVKDNSQGLQSGKSVFFDITTSAKIENGESIIGYQYLHGTSADVGGFHVVGDVRKDYLGNYYYSLTCTWNDMIDPNYKYASDGRKAAFAKKIPFANPTDYYISITWHTLGIINQP